MKTCVKVILLIPFCVILFSCRYKIKNDPADEGQKKEIEEITEIPEECQTIKDLGLFREFNTITKIAREYNECDRFFYSIIFYREGVSDLIRITYDEVPPMIFSLEKAFVGFTPYKNDYVIIYSTIDDTLLHSFIDPGKLNQQQEVLDDFHISSDGFFDPAAFIYKIDRNGNEPVLIFREELNLVPRSLESF